MENKILTIKEMVEGRSYIFKGTTGEYDKNRLVANNLFQLVATPQITCEYLGFNYTDTNILDRGYVFLIKNSEGWNDDGIVFYYDFSTSSMNLINQQKITTIDEQEEILSEVLYDGFTPDSHYFRLIIVPCDETTPNTVTNFKINSIYFNDGDIKYNFEDVTTSLITNTQYVGLYVKQYTYISPTEQLGYSGKISSTITDSSERRDIAKVNGEINYYYGDLAYRNTVDNFFIVPRTYFESGTVHIYTSSECDDVEAGEGTILISAQITCTEHELSPSAAKTTLYDDTTNVEINKTPGSGILDDDLTTHLSPISNNCSNVKIIINYSIS